MHIGRKLSLALIVLLLPALITLSSAESLAARYKAIVVEADTGKVLFSRYADKRHYPASLTKMMTLYLTFKAIESGALTFGKQLHVSKRAAGQTPSRIGLKAGQKIAVEDAILAIVTKSANDAATVLAEVLADTEVKFAKKMTETAKRLGMKNTVFRNASGLPNQRQISTARDLARLAQALLSEFPQYYHYFSTMKFTWGKRTYENHNKLLKTYKGADGLKTGYIRASGFNIATSAQRNGRRLIGIVLGGRTSKWRDRKMAYLMNVGFGRLQSLQVVERRKPVPKPRRQEMRGIEPKTAKFGPLNTIKTTKNSTRMPTQKPRSSKLDFIKPKPLAPPKAGIRAAASWGIQVGAFSTYGIAFQKTQDALNAQPKLLHSARAAVDRIFGNSRRLYRARLLGITEQSARDACRRLILNQFVCIPVPPDGEFLAIAKN